MLKIRTWLENHSRGVTAAVMAGTVLLIVVAGFLVVNLLAAPSGIAAPGDSPSPSAEPSLSASAPASASAEPSASAAPTPAPPSVSHDGPFAATVLVDDLNVREEPATGTVAGSLASGAVVMIQEGPRTVDGSDWYYVYLGTGFGGWVSAGPEEAPYLQFHERVASRLPAGVAGVAGGDAGYVAWGFAAQASTDASEPFVVASVDGSTWQFGDLPEAVTDPHSVHVAHGPSGWLMAVSNADGTALAGLWRSSDGLTWTPVDGTSDIGGPPIRLTGFGSGYVLGIRDDSTGTSVERDLLSSDGVTWREPEIPLAPGSPDDGFRLVPLDDGIVAWRQGFDGPSLVYYSPDGTNWTDASQGGTRAMITDYHVRMARLGNRLVAVSHDIGTGALRVWTATPSASGFDWVRTASAETQLDGTSIDSLVGLSDGALIVGHSFDDGRPRAWRTADGATWDELEAWSNASEGGIGPFAAGRAGMVGIGYDITSAGPNPYFMRSIDGGAWQGEAEPVLGIVESPVIGACPTPPATMADWLAVPGSIGAECFGDAPITFRGWLTVAGGCGGFFPGRFEPAWLANPFASGAVILEPSETDSGGCGSATRHPDLAEMPEPQQWVQVTGHWADAASATCRVIARPEDASGYEGQRGPDQMPFVCRTKFVATEVIPTTAP